MENPHPSTNERNFGMRRGPAETVTPFAVGVARCGLCGHMFSQPDHCPECRKAAESQSCNMIGSSEKVNGPGAATTAPTLTPPTEEVRHGRS